jgi:hypothetical protein
MPSYFLACTKNGILVSSHSLDEDLVDYNPRSQRIFRGGTKIPVRIPVVIKSVTLKNGSQRQMVSYQEVKIGFFACENPLELGYEVGEEIPVFITNKMCNDNKDNVNFFPDRYKICWASPDED